MVLLLVRRLGRHLNAVIALFPRVGSSQLGSHSQSRRSAAILRIPRLGNGRDKAIPLFRDGFDVERLVGRGSQGLAEPPDSRMHAAGEIYEEIIWPEMLAPFI